MAWPVKSTGMTWGTDPDGKQWVDVEGIGVFPVLSNEATPSSLKDRNGNVVCWPSVRKLVLSGDLVVYACADCSYVNRSENSIRPHRNKHRGKNKPPDDEVTELLRSTIRTALGGELPDRTAEIEKLTVDRDAWKQRALKAERAMSGLRQALGRLDN
jgi:hypothetical protein